MSMLSAKAVFIRAIAKGVPMTVRASGRYISMSFSRTVHLPLMNRRVRITALRAVSPGYLASMNGTAERLSFTVSHIPTDMTVRTAACTVRNISRAPPPAVNSEYAVMPKNTAGTSASSPMSFDHIRAAMLRRMRPFPSSAAVSGVSGEPLQTAQSL